MNRIKRENIHVFKLVHTCIKNDEVCIKTNIKEMNLIKLINSLQIIAVNMEETFDLSPSEMKDLLLLYEGIRDFPTEEDLKEFRQRGEDEFDYIEIDLYNVWEASNINTSNEEAESYKNEAVLSMIKNFIMDNNIALEAEKAVKKW